MSFNLGYAGIGVENATFQLDEETKTAIGKERDNAKGKAVALTGAKTVGFGAESGSPLFGIIQFIDGRGLVTIGFKGFFEDVPIKKFGSTPAYPSIGEFGLGVDNEGNVVKLTAGKRGIPIEITDTSADNTTTTILIS